MSHDDVYKQCVLLRVRKLLFSFIRSHWRQKQRKPEGKTKDENECWQHAQPLKTEKNQVKILPSNHQPCKACRTWPAASLLLHLTYTQPCKHTQPIL